MKSSKDQERRYPKVKPKVQEWYQERKYPKVEYVVQSNAVPSNPKVQERYQEWRYSKVKSSRTISRTKNPRLRIKILKVKNKNTQGQEQRNISKNHEFNNFNN